MNAQNRHSVKSGDPWKNDPIACLSCREFYLKERETLVAACATVGIEYGKSTGWMLRDYLTGFHQADHDPDFSRIDQSPAVADRLAAADGGEDE